VCLGLFEGSLIALLMTLRHCTSMQIKLQALPWAVGAFTLMALLTSNLQTRRMMDRSVLISGKQSALLQQPVLGFGYPRPIPVPVRVIHYPVSAVDDLDIIADMTINQLRFRHQIAKVKALLTFCHRFHTLVVICFHRFHAITTIYLWYVSNGVAWTNTSPMEQTNPQSSMAWKDEVRNSPSDIFSPRRRAHTADTFASQHHDGSHPQ
jgi:hypothetical protein